MRVAAITGLDAEARIIRRAGVTALPSGGRSARTLGAAQQLLEDGAEALVSFGIAGALAPHLAAGTLLLPRAVREEGGARHLVDEQWRARVEHLLAAAHLRAEAGDLLGAAAAAASPERKAALHAATGAVAIDLESHLVAQAAARAGRPFLVLRAIADPAARALPEAAVNGLDENGAPAIGRVLASLARHPGQLAGLLRLAGDTRAALFALRSAVKAGAF